MRTKPPFRAALLDNNSGIKKMRMSLARNSHVRGQVSMGFNTQGFEIRKE
jgi:hypothetical protein